MPRRTVDSKLDRSRRVENKEESGTVPTLAVIGLYQNHWSSNVPMGRAPTDKRKIIKCPEEFGFHTRRKQESGEQGTVRNCTSFSGHRTYQNHWSNKVPMGRAATDKWKIMKFPEESWIPNSRVADEWEDVNFGGRMVWWKVWWIWGSKDGWWDRQTWQEVLREGESHIGL